MHYGRRSDLALEAKELFESSAGKTTQLSGVRAREETLFGYPLTRVDILDETGAEALGKPVGTYLTLEFPALPQGREELLRAARAVAALLGQLPGLPDTGPVFVPANDPRRHRPEDNGSSPHHPASCGKPAGGISWLPPRGGLGPRRHRDHGSGDR